MPRSGTLHPVTIHISKGFTIGPGSRDLLLRDTRLYHQPGTPMRVKI